MTRSDQEAVMDMKSGLAQEAGPMFRLAWPVIISELGWMAMAIVDTVMVGQLGPEAIGAVGIGNVVFFSVAIFGIGLLLGMDTIVSQSFGAGELEDCHRSLVQGAYLALAVSLPLMALVGVCIGQLPRAHLEPKVQELVTSYLTIQNWSMPFLLVFFALRRYLQSLNLTVPILVALVVANLANLGGNWIFVYGRLGMPALGVAGSSYSTLISRVAMLVFLGAYALIRSARADDGLLRVSLRVDPRRQSDLIRLGFPTAIQLTLEVFVFGVAALLAGQFAADALAAHEVVLQIAGTAFMVPLGVSSAAAVRVGQAIGRKDPQGAARSGWTALLLGAGFMAMSGLTMLTFPRTLLGVFTTSSGVIAVARSILVAAAVFQIFDGLQIVGSGALRGLGETRVPMFATLCAHWAIGLPIGYVMAFPLGWGVIGLWIGLTSGLVVAGILILAAWMWRVRHLA